MKAAMASNAAARAGKNALGLIARNRAKAADASCAASASAGGSEKARTAAGWPSRPAASSRDSAA